MVQQEILELERAFWEGSGDQDFYRRHVSDEAVFVTSSGIMDKADVPMATNMYRDPRIRGIQQPTSSDRLQGIGAALR